MKTAAFLSCLLLAFLQPKAQVHFGPQDPRPPRIPEAATHSARQIADYLLKYYPTPEARATAAYAWVTTNIEYSRDSMMAINWSLSPEEKVAATLRRRKGVCDNFATLFAQILANMNIRAAVVNGLAKAGGTNSAHSWTAVNIDNQWLLCDPTWDHGSGSSKQFFMISPEAFITSHWPFDPLWQLLPAPVLLKDFERGWVVVSHTPNKVTAYDAVHHHLSLDSLQQLKAQELRMRSIGLDQNHLRNWYAYNNMNIAILLGEQDMNHYNSAVASVNEANDLLNRFSSFRNNAFTPPVADNELLKMLTPVASLLQQASQSLGQVSSGRANFQYDPTALLGKMEALQKRLQTQQRFLTTYLSSDSTRRQQLFYK